MSTRPSPCCAVSKYHAGRLIGRAGNQLGKMVNAFLGDGRMFFGPWQQVAEHRSNRRELPLQYRRDFVALGHDVVEQGPLLPREGERQAQCFESGCVDGHRLVGERVETRRDRARQVFGLALVVPGDDDHIAAPVGHESLQEVRTGVRHDAPAGRVLRPRVVAFDLAQVVVEVGPCRRIDVDGTVDVGVHVLLHERRMEMARVQNGELHRSSILV